MTWLVLEALPSAHAANPSWSLVADAVGKTYLPPFSLMRDKVMRGFWKGTEVIVAPIIEIKGKPLKTQGASVCVEGIDLI